ncbi:NACHT domain protein [Aspergillus aculeatinus CBS 121060]|uniref:NACHT domain protein n=1 Tax=Aspergillus aculeatinus CBS 121060 TaxID=1448322 RepID=A0ACD1GU69_9EURO|nr:NACHT domain protein [Aspergillus aculeatinus CBS 121060]RAH64741.1 NACHT domain protein [Aspergillus aculeatinus CBS 121060]
MVQQDPALEVFHQAQQSFRNSLKDPDLYREILASNSISEVYNATSKLQEEAAGKGALRNLARIRPFLDRLSSYSGVIEAFLQVKPELALLWGPIKLLLLWSSQLSSAFDRVADTMVKVGYALPQFATVLGAFEWSDAIRAALALFYGDLLDFYRVNLDFFRKRRWKQVFEAIWPSYQKKLDSVVGNIELHASLLRDEVTLVDVTEAQKARLKSLEQLAAIQTLQDRHRYTDLKGRIAPASFDERLDWIQNRSVPGCAKWLFQDSSFKQWADDTTPPTNPWLWLQGMPGAGKSYLCSAAVRQFRDKNQRCLFAVISHCANDTSTALKVLQSMLFQAADEEPDLQAVLLEAKERELRGSTLQVTELLNAFLRTADQTRIIIDGLDEIEEYERQVLLERLEDLVKGCPGVRILIGSRPEGDIFRRLDGKAITINVHDRNAGSIQHYINHRARSWINGLECLPTMETEIGVLLSPLAAKAKGQMDDIRRELRALPEDLNTAYHRILQRINDLSHRKRDQCRKILGWLGTAPIPLTTREMEQALSVEVDDVERTSRDQSSSQDFLSVDFVQLCGPIIEVADEKLQFVHFTAVVYIFSERVPFFINQAIARRNLLDCLLAYLMSGIVDLEVEEEVIQEQILRGRFRLFDYANFYWPVLLSSTLPSDWKDAGVKVNDPLVGRLDKVSQRLENPENFQNQIWGRVERVFSEANTEIVAYRRARNFAGDARAFYSCEKRWDWNRKNGASWVNKDPLVTSQMWLRLQRQHEALLAKSECRQDMERNYGSQLFRCTYLFCKRSLRGFATTDERDQHVQNHDRPWKCFVPSCDFSTIGFHTTMRRDQHWKQYHVLSALETHGSEAAGDNDATFDALDEEEAQPLLFVLISEGQVDRVRHLISSPAGKKLKSEVLAHARLMAAEQGSLALTELLAPASEERGAVPIKIRIAAVTSDQDDFGAWALESLKVDDLPSMMSAVLKTRSEGIFGQWEQMILTMIENPDLDPKLRLHWWEWTLFRQSLFTEIQGNELKEARVKRLLSRLGPYLPVNFLGTLLVRVARSSCSVALGEQLLQVAAKINHHAANGQTALYIASRKTSVAAAFFMKFLILRGAETSIYLNGEIVKLCEGKGALELAQKVGYTWQELRAQVGKEDV